MTLPECVNAWLEATGKKQNAVAKKAGLKASQVSEIASGKINPRWSAVEKLAKGFGVSPAKFLAGPPRPEGSGDEHVSSGGSGAGLADSLRRALTEFEQTGQYPKDWRGDIMLAIFALTRALQQPNVAAESERQDRKAQ